MSQKVKVALIVVLSALLVPAGLLFAVSDQEIEKMRQAMPDKPVVKPEQPRHMLVFNLTEGFNHTSIPYWAKALEIMAEKTGAFTIEHSEDKAVFSTESLARFDAICFNNTVGLRFNPAQREALMAFVNGGKGIVGIHAATDNFPDWPEASHMMGGVFQGHPWNADRGEWAIKLDEPDHPLMASFEGKGFRVNDEIYRTNLPFYSRERQRVLMSLDMSDPATRNVRGVVPEDEDTGISWIKPYGKGRIFYCSLGHTHHITWTTPILWHYLAGIQYALGDLKVDDTPLGDPAAAMDTEPVKALIEKIKTYDWGRSRVDLIELQSIIQQNYESPANLLAIERLLLPLLSAESNRAVQDFVCRELSVIGTGVSVPALTALLDTLDTEHMARYALERIPDAAVDTALLRKLNQASETNSKIGLISSLGRRRSKDAVAPLGRIAAASDKPAAKAAVQALGAIGTPQAGTALRELRASFATDLQPYRLEALVVCADNLLADGNTAQAMILYEELYKADNPSLIRVAALTGISQAGRTRFGQLLPAAVKSDDAVVQACAIRLVAQVREPAVIEAVVSSMSGLSDAARVSLLAALTVNGHPSGRQAAESAMSSPNASVRIAGLRAIGVLGNGSSVVPLAKAAAATTSDRNERDAARETLNQIQGDDVADAIIRGIRQTVGQADTELVAVELLRAIPARGITTANALLFEMAQHPSGRVAQEAVRSLQSSVTQDDIPAAVNLLVNQPGTTAEAVALAAVEQIPDLNRRATVLLAGIERAESSAAKVSIVRVLGRLGDPQAVGTIRRLRASSDSSVSDAAFRAMLDWPGMDFFDEIHTLATTGPDSTDKVLAFRTYIRLLASGKGKTESEIVNALTEALTMTDRLQEQRSILAALGELSSESALRQAQKMMDNAELRAEAEAAVVGISTRLIERNPDAAIAALQAISEQTSNNTLRQQIRRLVTQAESRIGHILSWQISGPYMQVNKSAEELFDFAFLPETNPAQAQWTPMTTSGGRSNFWLMDLASVMDGSDRVAYARAVLVSPQEIKAILEIGSDDGVKVWLNGQVVHRNNVTRGVTQGEDKVDVQLRQGENELMLKITQGASDWGFCVRVTNTDGSPMRGLSVK